MLNAVYRLVAPRRVEIVFNDIDLLKDSVIVRPTHLSICHADQRYYQGLRKPEILKEKLPMALIHEGIGEVVFDPKKQFNSGDLVVLIPNIPTQTDEIIKENYLRSSKFRGSNIDGFMQENIAIDRKQLICIPNDIDKPTAALTELVSVSVHAINKFSGIAHKKRDKIGVWGDGNLGYITALLLKIMFKETKIAIFGVDSEKLERFTFADEIYSVADLPRDIKIDHAFECVGNEASSQAINQIISNISPEGTISILGVSEYDVPINTRLILEKGLQLIGSSRSGREDFIKTIEIYKNNPSIFNYLSNIVGEVIEVRTIKDIANAFDIDMKNNSSKTIMVWNM